MKKLIASLLLTICAAANASDLDSRFGKVSREELEMTSYAPDTSAVAVYLYSEESTELVVQPSSFTNYRKVRRRIKVLKDEGKSYADFEIPYNRKADEHVSGIKLTTFNLVDGKVKATRMSSKYIFDEQITEGLYSVKFTAPEVSVGSVVEVEYTFESEEFWIFPEIHLQKMIPVVNGLVTVTYPSIFQYQKFQRGYNQVQYVQQKENISAGGVYYEAVRDIYEYKYMPAYRSEDYCWCSSFYSDVLVYELKQVPLPNGMKQTYNTQWEDIDKSFAESEMFRTMMQKKPYLKKELDALQLEGMSDEQKIAEVRAMVIDKVAWNEYVGFGVDIPEAIKRGTGSDSDINCLVGQSLRYLGFRVCPVVLREKDEGLLIPFNISITSYTKMLLQISGADKTWYVDASDPDGYLNVLPPNCLVDQARVLDEDGKGSWVSLDNLCKNKDYTVVEGSVSPDGTFTFTSTMDMVNSEAYAFRSLMDGEKDEEKRLEILEGLMGAELDSAGFEGLDGWSPQIKVKASGSAFFDSADGTIYINPFVRRFHDIHSFEKEHRTFPVEFEYPESVTYIVTIHLPEGYEVVELPQNTGVMMSSLGSQLRTFYAAGDPQTVTLNYQYRRNALYCEASEYADLRSYWRAVSDVYNDRIVIRKIQ